MHNNILNILIKKSSNLSWMNDGLLFFVRHGSRAYNCHTAESDDDYKGACVPPKRYYFGNLNKIEQAELKEPDTVIFEIKKFVSLAVQANPNILETLFVAPEDQLYISKVGQILFDNRNLFLSKKIYHTMNGYAYQQIKRMKNHRAWILNPPKGAPSRKDFELEDKPKIPKNHYDAIKSEIKKKLDKFNFNFIEQLTNDQRIGIKEITADIIADMQISKDDMWLGAARSIGLDDNIIEIIQKERNYENALNTWHAYLNWKKNRNPKRFADEKKLHYDAKFMYHVFRLYSMCEEALSIGKLIVKRPDRDFIMSIRRGEHKYEDLMDLIEEKNEKCKILYNTSDKLPHIPNYKKIDELCINIIEQVLDIHKSKDN